ncbi:3-hydroxyacyl-CoA dehydrogenase/enoyl-CoA hydratase family protein [candidate division KSB1 bacterium]
MVERKYKWNDVEILFIGAGTMGASLAQAYAQNGFVVGLLDISDDILDNAMEIIGSELDSVRGRIFTDEQIESVKSKILTTRSYKTACKSKSLNIVIEAATERIDIKKDIFRTLDKLCAPHVVLATNSSSLDANILAKVTKRPDKVVWMHYFYLPHKNRGGEYAGTDTASEESKRVAEKYMKLGGKIPTPVLSSRKGGAADIIFVSLLLEAVRMLEEGYKIAEIENAGMKAYNIPIGFLQLMDMTGLPVGLYSMYSFSDNSDKDYPLYKVYKDFYYPPQAYIDIIDRFNSIEDKDSVKWIPDTSVLRKKANTKNVKLLCERFWGVGFMTSIEVVEAGVIRIEDLEYLCQNAFVWQKGPFTIMNELGVKNVLRYVKNRAALAKKQGYHFPVPKILEKQAKSGKPWKFELKPVFYLKDKAKNTAFITFSSPKTANAMDNDVFGRFKESFNEAEKDRDTKVIIFDTAPIKTFIAGANVPSFIENIEKGKFKTIVSDTRNWQKVMFNDMTRGKKPRIAIIDGQTFGGGVEVAMAFADDPNSIVLVTERTSFTLPETKLGIYPGLRGTLLMPQLIYKATGNAELAVAMARYYILAAGTTTSSPRMIKYLGMADAIVPSHRRDEAAAIIADAIIKNKGKMITKQKLNKLKFPRLPDKLTFEEENEIRTMQDLFLTSSLLPSLTAFGLGWKEPFLIGDEKTYAKRISRRVFSASPNAVNLTDWLISKGFKDYLDGVDTDTLAKRELDKYLQEVFEHPDALEGLKAMVERRFPEFNREYPF